MNPRVQLLTVRTPEGVVFATQLAGPAIRFLAWGVDLLCVSALSQLISYGSALLGMLSSDLASGLAILFTFILSIAYSIVLEWFWRGQTLGKRLLRLRVMDLEGIRLQPSQVVVRNLVRAIDFFPAFYVVGGIACLISRHAQRLGDIAANTVVVRIPRLEAPDVEQLLAGKFNSLRGFPHLEARLRQRISPAEADLALRALMRRENFEPAERLEVFGELAAHFRESIPFPPEASEGITDEQYVRNVVDTLFRKRASNAPRPAAQPATGLAATS